MLVAIPFFQIAAMRDKASRRLRIRAFHFSQMRRGNFVACPASRSTALLLLSRGRPHARRRLTEIIDRRSRLPGRRHFEHDPLAVFHKGRLAGFDRRQCPAAVIFPHAQPHDISRRRIEENPDALSAAEDRAEQCNRGAFRLLRRQRPHRHRSDKGWRGRGWRAARGRENRPFPRV